MKKVILSKNSVTSDMTYIHNHCCPVNCERRESVTFINDITRMEAGVEPPWMALRRVDGGCVRFMSRISATLIQACYISLSR